MTLKVKENIEENIDLTILTRVNHRVSIKTNHLMISGNVLCHIELMELKPKLLENISDNSYVDKYVSQLTVSLLFNKGLLDESCSYVSDFKEHFNGIRKIEFDATQLSMQHPWAYYDVLYSLYSMFNDYGVSVRNVVVKMFTKRFYGMNPANIPSFKGIYSQKRNGKGVVESFHFTCPDVFKTDPADYYVRGAKINRSLNWIVYNSLLRFLYENDFIDFGKSYVESIKIDEYGYIDAKVNLTALFSTFPYAYMTFVRQLSLKFRNIGEEQEALEALRKQFSFYCPINIYGDDTLMCA